MEYWTSISSPLGALTLTARGDRLTGLRFSGHRGWRGLSAGAQRRDDYPVLVLAQAQLDAYFGGATLEFTVPLDLQGTVFQRAVWDQLRRIPRGGRCTYRQIAEWIGRPNAVRAVGTAAGRNPFCIIVPCHRLLRSDQQLAGYAGGLDRKRELLRLESMQP